MKSPYTGKEMKKMCEESTWTFEGETFPCSKTYWVCEDSGHHFTTTESDTASYIQATNQYRAKHGIPYTDEIIGMRNRYGMSVKFFAALLGVSEEDCEDYENDAVPPITTAKIIRSLNNPKTALDLIQNTADCPVEERDVVISNLQRIIADSKTFKLEQYETEKLFSVSRGMADGFAPQSLSRLRNIMLYVLKQCGEVWCTKMNKLLFYIDFLSYRERGIAMTGLSYKAIDFGPVPEHWDKVYSAFNNISQELRAAGEFVGSKLVAHAEPNIDMFSASELAVMDAVCERFAQATSRDISQTSHDEEAWKKYHTTHSSIPFTEAVTLKAF